MTGKSTLRRVARLLLPLVLIVILPLGFIAACQSKLIYLPRPYPAGESSRWEQQRGGRAIDFETSQGRQRAFLQGNLESPRNLWIVCGGNGSVALDWSQWLAANTPADDAWLLVDYPGYGDCSGAPNPGRIAESLREAVPLACSRLGWSADPAPGRLRIFGHSLGAAAGLIAASEFGIQKGVLLAPFTSTMDMGRVMTGLPVGFLVLHRFDNRARLAELSTRGPGQIIILHGTGDEIVPVSMARQLAGSQPTTVELRELPGGRHNSIPHTHTEELARALEQAAQ